ncbi:MAG TPA: SLATT domain-containing protein [Actinomycetota bacterium]
MPETEKRSPARTMRQIPWSADVLALLKRWEHRADVVSRLHYQKGAFFNLWNTLVGLPVIVLTTLVGTSLFATIQDSGAFALRITAATVSVLAAILASVHRFLRLAELAEGHRVAGNRWAAIKREIEKTRSLHPTYPDVRGDPIHYLDKIINQWNRVAGESPTLGRTYNESSEHLDREIEEAGLDADQPAAPPPASTPPGATSPGSTAPGSTSQSKGSTQRLPAVP